MRLNSLKPAPGSKRPRLRVGRGASAGQGKTCGRGVKGQRARKGGYHKVGFEGGQTPLDRRLPKFGFRSHMAVTRAEVRLSELGRVNAETIDLESLKKAGIVPEAVERAKVVLSGEIKKAVTLKGIGATKGARAAIEAAGGQVLEPPSPPPAKAKGGEPQSPPAKGKGGESQGNPPASGGSKGKKS
jgi:large subunit ribosomal protein L15